MDLVDFINTATSCVSQRLEIFEIRSNSDRSLNHLITLVIVANDLLSLDDVNALPPFDEDEDRKVDFETIDSALAGSASESDEGVRIRGVGDERLFSPHKCRTRDDEEVLRQLRQQLTSNLELFNDHILQLVVVRKILDADVVLTRCNSLRKTVKIKRVYLAYLHRWLTVREFVGAFGARALLVSGHVA